MTSCEAIAERLTAFFDGEIEGAGADLVAAHLEGCARCRARLEDLERIDGRLRRIEAPPVVEGEWRRVWGVIEGAIAADAPVREAAERSARAAARLVRLMIPLAAAVLVLAGAYGFTLASAHAGVEAAAEHPGEADALSRVALVGLSAEGDR